MTDLRLGKVLAVLVGCLSAPAWAQSIDQGFHYKLSTQFRGNGMKLEVFNGGPKDNMMRIPTHRGRDSERSRTAFR